LDALIHRGLFYELSRRNVSTADEMYCRAQEIDGKRAKDKYDQVNPKFSLVSSSVEVYLHAAEADLRILLPPRERSRMQLMLTYADVC
jgi:hypothetical protein